MRSGDVGWTWADVKVMMKMAASWRGKRGERGGGGGEARLDVLFH